MRRSTWIAWVCLASAAGWGAGALAQEAADGEAAEIAAPVVSVIGPNDEAALDQLVEEIDAMLSPDGLVAPTAEAAQDVPTRGKLERIASDSGRIARENVDQPELQYRARQVELRAYNALAQEALAHDREAEASFRLTQLRSAATQARRVDNRYAPATADFWLLLADLTDINRNITGIEPRQAQATAKLEAYLVAHGEQDTPRDITTHIKAALIRLHTQSGDNARACELLDGLRQVLAEDDPRLLSLADADAVCRRVGKAVAFEVTTLDGLAWASATQADRRVLIHFFADFSPQSLEVFDTIAQAKALLDEAGVSVVSIGLGGTRRVAGDQAWPVGTAAITGDLVEAMGVKGLPWLVVLDEQGRIASIGQTDAVIHRAFAPAEPETPQPTEPQPEATEG